MRYSYYLKPKQINVLNNYLFLSQNNTLSAKVNIRYSTIITCNKKCLKTGPLSKPAVTLFTCK